MFEIGSCEIENEAKNVKEDLPVNKIFINNTSSILAQRLDVVSIKMKSDISINSYDHSKEKNFSQSFEKITKIKKMIAVQNKQEFSDLYYIYNFDWGVEKLRRGSTKSKE